MPLRRGATHGAHGLVAVLLAVKLVVKKGALFLEDFVVHQILHTPLDLLFVQLPVSVFGGIGGVVVSVLGSDLPPAAVGLVVVYPILVVLVVGVAESPSRRGLAAYWLGSTLVTSFAVVASLGIAPDPAGVGSGLHYHLQHHTVAVFVRDGVVSLGQGISTASTATVGVPLDESVGLVLAATLAAAAYGVVWELHVGHE